MKRINHIYVIITLMIIVFAIGHLTSSLKHKLSPQYQEEEKTFQQSPLSSSNIKFSSRLHSGLYYVVEAAKGQKQQNKDIYSISHVKATVYFSPKKEHPYYMLTADTGIINKDKSLLSLNKNVVFTKYNPQGTIVDSLKTEQININFQTNELSSDKSTTNDNQQYNVTGDQGFKVIDNHNKIFFLGHVSANLKSTIMQPTSKVSDNASGNASNKGSDKIITHITAQKYLYLNKKKNFYFATNNPSITSGDVKAQSDNYLVVVTNKKEHKPKSAFAQGNIIVTSRDITAKGQSYLFDQKKNRMTLWGQRHPFGYYDKIENFPPMNDKKQAIITQGANSFQADKFLTYTRIDPKTNNMYIRQIQAVGHIVSHNQGNLLSGDTAYYNVITKVAMICGHAKVVSSKSILKGHCIKSDFNTGESEVVGKKTGKQTRILIFQ